MYPVSFSITWWCLSRRPMYRQCPKQNSLRVADGPSIIHPSLPPSLRVSLVASLIFAVLGPTRTSCQRTAQSSLKPTDSPSAASIHCSESHFYSVYYISVFQSFINIVPVIPELVVEWQPYNTTYASLSLLRFHFQNFNLSRSTTFKWSKEC